MENRINFYLQTAYIVWFAHCTADIRPEMQSFHACVHPDVTTTLFMTDKLHCAFSILNSIANEDLKLSFCLVSDPTRMNSVKLAMQRRPTLFHVCSHGSSSIIPFWFHSRIWLWQLWRCRKSCQTDCRGCNSLTHSPFPLISVFILESSRTRRAQF